MSKQSTTHQESFTIRANEVDITGKATLPAILSLFQEVAGNNAKALNFDITDMHEQNLTWVLHRMDININRLPDWRQTITIETWPASGDALRAYRNYRILDDSGNELINCLSYWMIINLETRRATRIPEAVLATRLTEREHVTPVKSNRIRPFRDGDKNISFTVRRSDLDMNNHVNNARFMEWMVELLSYEEIHSLSNFDIVFMHEGLLGDTLTSSVKHTEEKSVSFTLSNQTEQPIAVAEATLRN
ncbi:MAG TPA: acyl-[acyl-carrier-protein] thioesterase [Balneolaceae bacterium]|nr:acyl-[acyl-carrier-protein] thioesterase [Balneolaceae bacterium]|tara:strand:+ start:127228 stop:127965 length:738 start_codon:yes stop_codon:yes gene_type:complete